MREDFGEFSRAVFAADGLISRSLAGFEERLEQIQMAGAVHKALVCGRHLVVEAGTGVGKSFAYLVPAIRLVHRAHRRGGASPGGTGPVGKKPSFSNGMGK